MKSGFIIISSFLLLLSCHTTRHNLTIATAANVQFAMEEVVKQFSDDTGIPCDVIIGSSGMITAQIKSGAPYDIFISADMKYPNSLYKEGFTTGEPKVYASGKLVLWSMHIKNPEINMLDSNGIIRIAMANPITAPYGAAAKESLNYYGIYNSVKDKLVLGESISQTNQFILSGSVQMGITSKSVVLSPEMKGKGSWTELDEKSYSPITQGAVIIKHADQKAGNATIFYNFLFSNKAKEIFIKYGYLVSP